MKPQVRAVIDGALVMLATLLALMLSFVVVSSLSAETLVSKGFFWGYAVTGGLILLVGAAVAATLAAKRLATSGWSRTGLAAAGPLLVVALVVVPSLAAGDWAGSGLYLGATLAGVAVGLFGVPHLVARRRRA